LDGQGNDRGVKANGGVGGVPDFSIIIAKTIAKLTSHPLSLSRQPRSCTYKDFLACNPKQYDGKEGAIAYTHWIEKMELVQDMSGCGDNQKVKYTIGSFVGKALTWWNSHIHTRSREATVRMSWEDFKKLTREEFCSINEI
ncbi:hypothetical protein Tco_0161043, partial [Tanacetum coccineum]